MASLSTEKKTDQWAKHRLTLIYEEFSETVPGLLKIFQHSYMPWLFLCWDKLRSSWRPNSTNQRKRGQDSKVRLVHKYMRQVLTKPVNKDDLFSRITFDDLRSSFDHLCASLSIYYQSERMQQCRTNQEYLPILGDSTCVEGPGV